MQDYIFTVYCGRQLVMCSRSLAWIKDEGIPFHAWRHGPADFFILPAAIK